MKENSKNKKKYFWRIIFLLLILFVLYQQFPVFFKNTIGTLITSVKLKTSKNRQIKWKTVQNGIDICSIAAKNAQTTFPTDVFMVRFDSKYIQTKVIYDRKLNRAKHIVDSTGAIAAINASFFTPQGKPLGLLVQDEIIVQRLPQKSMLNSGIFCIKHGYPTIFHRDNFQKYGIKEAVQSMPRLIHDRDIIDQIKNKHEPKRRSGIATDFKGRIIIYITETHFSGLSFNDLQNILLRPELGIRSALNLDGGGSSQLYLKTSSYEKNIPGLVDVPVFLCFYKK